MVIYGWTHIRAHQHSSRAAFITDEAILRSIGGNSSKIHMTVDTCGNPYEFFIANSTTHDVKVVPELVSKVSLCTTEYMRADKGYHSDNLR